MDWNTRDVSGDSEAMLSFFGCSKFSVRVCNTSDVLTGQTFAINWSKIQLSWVLMLYYQYKTMFSAYKSVTGSPRFCDLNKNSFQQCFIFNWSAIWLSAKRSTQGVMHFSWKQNIVENCFYLKCCVLAWMNEYIVQIISATRLWLISR